MRKEWVLYAVAVLAIAGFACNGGGEDPTATTAPTATTPPVATMEAEETMEPVVEPTAMPSETMPAATTAAPTGDVAVLTLASVRSDELLFDTDMLTVKTGSTVRVEFSNHANAQQHNWALVKQGTKDDVTTRGVLAPTTDWLMPDDPDVIASIGLIDPGETGSVTFTAPEPGVYEFVCTFPAHNVTMYGVFEVTP